MKNHPKTYEDVFSTDSPRNNAQLKFDKISVGELDLNEYTLLFKNYLGDFYSDLFDKCVKLSWLRRKFCYHGYKTILPMYKNPPLVNSAFVKFLRRRVGNDLQIITRGPFFNKWEVFYFDKFFPNFLKESPFENPDYYKFPFKNISPEFLIVVYQLDDRFSLLKEADKKDMSYAVFADYVINHVLCENDDLGRDKYYLKLNWESKLPFFIRDVDKKLVTKSGKKRI